MSRAKIYLPDAYTPDQGPDAVRRYLEIRIDDGNDVPSREQYMAVQATARAIFAYLEEVKEVKPSHI